MYFSNFSDVCLVDEDHEDKYRRNVTENYPHLTVSDGTTCLMG